MNSTSVDPGSSKIASIDFRYAPPPPLLIFLLLLLAGTVAAGEEEIRAEGSGGLLRKTLFAGRLPEAVGGTRKVRE
jgi:hypothetical protein